MAADLREAQQKVRQDALEMSSALSEVRQWEQSVRKKDQTIRNQKQPAVASNQSNKNRVVLTGKSDKPDNAYYYDKGYKYWENFDVDKALEESDECQEESSSNEPYGQFRFSEEMDVNHVTRQEDIAEVERERGNKFFREGSFQQAIDAYTRGLVESPKNVTLLSNRAMAFVKMRLFENAVKDASDALEYDPSHVKSLVRRAKALANLGRLKDALVDLSYALSLEPSNKHVRSEMRKTQELRNSSMHKEPLTEVSGEVGIA